MELTFHNNVPDIDRLHFFDLPAGPISVVGDWAYRLKAVIIFTLSLFFIANACSTNFCSFLMLGNSPRLQLRTWFDQNTWCCFTSKHILLWRVGIRCGKVCWLLRKNRRLRSLGLVSSHVRTWFLGYDTYVVYLLNTYNAMI